MATCANTTSPTQLTPTPSVSILDFFIPGFTGISAAAQQLSAGKLNSFASLLCVCGLLLYLVNHLSKVVESHLSSTVHITQWSETHNMVHQWVFSQPFARNARSFKCRISRTEEKSLNFSPWNGTFPFIHRGRLFWYRSKEKSLSHGSQEEVSLSCLGRSPAPLHELLHECRKKYLESGQNKTAIFENQDGQWKEVKARDIRPISTIIIDKKKKADLLKDMKDFLSPESHAWYKARGLSYRRGYLLYGPPGTGKTSLGFSAAGECGLPIYNLSLAKAEPKTFNASFADLPPRCVLLLEDVDAVGITQSRQAGASTHQASELTCKLSLSDLLNAIDGVASQEGRVLIMTTNHIERLDDALIRPGRVDKRIELLCADEDTINGLFCLMFQPMGGDANKKLANAEMVKRLAGEFARKVPPGEFSPAAIESFLLRHKDSSQTAVELVEGWVTKTWEEKKKKEGASGR